MPDVKFSNQYPYTDFHELNLDWVIKEVKYWSTKVGKTIQSIELTGTVGLVDTYTINYSDGSTSTFDVTNGAGIASIVKTGTVGLVDTYTITLQDGSTSTFEVHNGTASIDPTLTLSDYAADANATGTIFRAISELVEPVNLFNKNSPLIRNGYKFSKNGDYSTLSGSSVSHPIKIDHSKAYCFKYYSSYYGVTANRVIRRCDASGNLIQISPMYQDATDVGTAYGYVDFSVSSWLDDWEYFVVMVRTSGLNDMIIAEGTTLPAYSEYFDPYYQIKPSAIPGSVISNGDPLYQKTAAFTGDSICYGAGYAGGYAGIIGTDNDMGISNTGKTGATLATGTTSGGVNRYWISDLVGQMPAGYDYYIVEGGVNDADVGLGVQLGALSSGYTATLDTTTLYGAVESICKTLQTTFAGKKIGFVIPHNCYPQSHRWNTEFRPAIKEACEKWGVPYLDLSELVPQLYNLTALRVYTDNNDGWHPNEQGYKLFYVPKIEAWMKTL